MGIGKVIREILAGDGPAFAAASAALACPGHFWDYPALACASKGLIAMRATHLLFGCVAALGLVAPAYAATNVDAGSVGASDCAHAGASDSSTSRDAAAPAGDSIGLPHITGAPSSSSAPAASGSRHDDSVITGSGGSDDAAPAPTRHVSLGWQSLLPGSIQ